MNVTPLGRLPAVGGAGGWETARPTRASPRCRSQCRPETEQRPHVSTAYRSHNADYVLGLHGCPVRALDGSRGGTDQAMNGVPAPLTRLRWRPVARGVSSLPTGASASWGSLHARARRRWGARRQAPSSRSAPTQVPAPGERARQEERRADRNVSESPKDVPLAHGRSLLSVRADRLPPRVAPAGTGNECGATRRQGWM
jgi:hypothetical protein